MKILFHSIVVVMAAALGLSVGFALRAKSKMDSQAMTPQITNVRTSIISQPKLFHGAAQRIASHTRTFADSPLTTKLSRDLSMSSGVTRWLYWLEAIEKAQLPDFPRLAQLANGNSTAIHLLAARWMDLSPRHLFDTLVASMNDRGSFPTEELASALFAEWPKRDPDAAIAALSGPEDFARRHNWRMNVVNALMAKDVERGIRVMSEWHIDNYLPSMNGVAKWAAANPRHAAEFAFANSSGYGSRVIIETVGSEWARTDPAGALQFAGANSGDLNVALASAVVKNWAQQNLDEAADWLGKADARLRNRLSPAFVESWAKMDATAALDWCETNLVGSSFALAVGGVVKGVAEKDVVGAAALVSNMAPSLARTEAATALGEKWFQQNNSDQPISPDAKKWLASLDADSMKRVLERVEWRWADADPKGLADFVSSVSSDRIPDYTYSTLARGMARKNPTEALEWASHLPTEQSARASTEVFAEWRRSQPEVALNWLSELPPDDARRKAFFENTIQAFAWEPDGTGQITALKAADREAARKILQTVAIPEDRRAKLLEAIK